MRGVLMGVAAMGVGGAAFNHGFGDSPDFSREVHKSPSAVYSAFSALAEAGENTTEAGPAGVAITQRVTKVSGKSIVVEALAGGKSAIRIEVDFSSAQNGAATAVVGEVDVDPAVLSTLDPDLGRAFQALPTAAVDIGFAKWMGDNVRKIEAGIPLENFDITNPGFSDSTGARSPSAAVNARRWEAEEAQRRAAAPMTDPNQAARDYMNGRPGD
jgi:hypothetical protein